MNTTRNLTALALCLLMTVPLTSGAMWGVGLNAFTEDEDHLYIHASAHVGCEQDYARANAFAEKSGYYSAIATAGGSYGPAGTQYTSVSYGVYAKSDYAGPGPTEAYAQAQSGAHYVSIGCNSSKTGGGLGGVDGLHPVADVVDEAGTVADVTCTATRDSVRSVVEGVVAKDVLGNAFVVGERDGEPVVLPGALDSRSSAITAPGVVESLTATDLRVQVHFDADFCGVAVKA